MPIRLLLSLLALLFLIPTFIVELYYFVNYGVFFSKQAQPISGTFALAALLMLALLIILLAQIFRFELLLFKKRFK
jgi:hypothetical protein